MQNTQNKSRKILYQLMANSMAIQSLDPEKKIEMQDRLLSLPDYAMKNMISILQKEQADLEVLHKRAVQEQKEAKKIYGMAQSLRDAGRRLDKAFLISMESNERNEASQASNKLLDEIEHL